MSYLKIILVSFLFVLPSEVFSSTCIEIKSKTHLESVFLPKIKGKESLVFFASWCGICKEKMSQSKPLPTQVYVAFQDEKDRAERVMNYLRIGNLCFFDSNGLIAKKYGVSAVPAEVTLRQ